MVNICVQWQQYRILEFLQALLTFTILIKIWGQKDGIIELNKTFYFSFNTHWALEFVFIKRSFVVPSFFFVQTLSCSYETQCKSSMHVANMKNPKNYLLSYWIMQTLAKKWIDRYNLVYTKNRLEKYLFSNLV